MITRGFALALWLKSPGVWVAKTSSDLFIILPSFQAGEGRTF